MKCKNCGKLITGKKVFCNKSCAAIYNNKKRKKKKYIITCSSCKKEFEVFGWQNSGRRICDKSYECQYCKKPLQKNRKKFCSEECYIKWDYKNRYKKRENNRKKRKIRLKLKLIKLKDNKCSICGYQKNSGALVFHHEDPDKKNFRLSIENIAYREWEEVLKEAEKCVLLCANCHSKVHYIEENIIIHKQGCFFCGKPLPKGKRKYCSQICKARAWISREKKKLRKEEINYSY